MSINVEIEKIVSKEIVTIQTPFYYKHDLMLDECDSVIYGKVTDECIVTIQKTERYARNETEFEFTKEANPHFQSSRTYLTEEEHKSSKEEYDSAIEEMKQFLEKEA
jgi:hypothetical protein